MKRAVSLQLLSRSISVGCGATITVMVARVLEPQDYGLFGLASTIVAGLVFVADPGVSHATARYASESLKSAPRLRAFLAAGVRILGLTLLFAGAAGLGLMLLLQGLAGTSHIRELFPMLIGISIMLGASAWLNRVFEAVSRLDLQAAGQVVHAFLYLFLTYVLLSEFELGVRAPLSAQLMALLFQVLLAAFLLHRWIALRGADTVEAGREGSQGDGWSLSILSYSVPVLLTNLAFFLFRRSDILLVQYFLGSTQVGYYFLQMRVIELAHMPFVIGASLLSPYFSRGRLGSEDQARIFDLLFRAWLLVTIPVCTGIALMASPFVDLLFGEQYQPAVSILIFFSIGFLPFYSVSALVSMVLLYRGRAAFRAKVLGVTAACNLLLNLVLIPRFGLIGAVAATVTTYVPAVFLYVHESAREMGCNQKALLTYFYYVLCATVAMAGVAHLVSGLFGASQPAQLLVTPIVAGGFYFLVIRHIRVFRLDTIIGFLRGLRAYAE